MRKVPVISFVSCFVFSLLQVVQLNYFLKDEATQATVVFIVINTLVLIYHGSKVSIYLDNLS